MRHHDPKIDLKAAVDQGGRQGEPETGRPRRSPMNFAISTKRMANGHVLDRSGHPLFILS